MLAAPAPIKVREIESETAPLAFFLFGNRLRYDLSPACPTLHVVYRARDDRRHPFVDEGLNCHRGDAPVVHFALLGSHGLEVGIITHVLNIGIKGRKFMRLEPPTPPTA